ncbi:hypothetical protein E2N92_00630 [Methanofollis formosanus]|uniref:Uncharacterized protein n=1 Tax=Methanofollis formosanus TaxID=299308 RepID=A0A8G1A072_9EURY|nr:hypothetical protein [Methanofollis formosanus]QYZ78039.1 hypothetical protein E2N92_00630 [Methanofollis formosanus]
MIEPDTPTLLFKRTVGRGQALEAVRAWWDDRLMARDLRDRARVIECRLKYYPFWRLTACVKGRVEGYRIESNDVTSWEVPTKAALDRDFVWTRAASDTSALGVSYLRNLDGETVLSDAFIGQVTVPEEEGIAEGRRAMERGAQRHSGVPHVTGHKIFLWHPQSTLLIYPFWVVRYLYADRTYFATVDGVTGDLVAGRAPGNLFRRIFAFVAATAASILTVVVWVVVLERSVFRDAGPVSDLDIFLLVLAMPMITLYGWGMVIDAFTFSCHGAKITAGDVHGGYRHSQDNLPSEQMITLTAGIVLGFLFMVGGGLVFYHWRMWPGLVAAVAGLVVHILSCTCWYNPAWETEGRRRARNTRPMQREEEW